MVGFSLLYNCYSHCPFSECPSLGDVPDGSVTVSGFRTGDTAVYSCDEGFDLDGESTRVCRSDSTWSGEHPVCFVCPVVPGIIIEL